MSQARLRAATVTGAAGSESGGSGCKGVQLCRVIGMGQQAAGGGGWREGCRECARVALHLLDGMVPSKAQKSGEGQISRRRPG